MSQIIITYTPQLTSSVINSSPFICHRICYRLVGETTYCCIEDNTDSTSGIQKTFTIEVADGSCSPDPANVDPQSCTNTPYEGYIQACCEDEATFAGAVYWTADFIADPDCANKSICCINQVPLALTNTFNITNGGSGYGGGGTASEAMLVVRNPLDPVTAGGANDASLTFHYTAGVVDDWAVISGGLYGITPTLVIPSPGGGGTTATAFLTIPCTSSDSYIGDCEGNAPTQIFPLLGQCVNYCLPKASPYIYDNNILSDPPNTTDFSYNIGECCDCTACKNFTVTTLSLLTTITICYTSCETDTSPATGGLPICITSPPTPGSGSITIDCAVPGSIYCEEDPNAIISIVEGSPSVCATCP